MKERIVPLARLGAVLAHLFCLAGGIALLAESGFRLDGDALGTGLGLYFIGKAFFVGPMLWIAAEHYGATLARNRDGN